MAAFGPSVLGVAAAFAWGIGVTAYLGEVDGASDLFLRLAIHRPWSTYGLGCCIGCAASSLRVIVGSDIVNFLAEELVGV